LITTAEAEPNGDIRGEHPGFHHYIGPRIRNIINLFARKERLARNGVCEDCGEAGKELDAAHVHGKDRRTIIETVLCRYNSEGIIRYEIGIIEREVLAEHGTISDAFKFLCKECHVRYDNKLPPRTRHLYASGPKAPNLVNAGRLEMHFFPPDEAKFKSMLLNRKGPMWRFTKQAGEPPSQ
jgi:hypothetical protein